MIRKRTLAAGGSLVLLAGSVGGPAALAQDTMAGEAVTIPADGHDITGTFVMPQGADGAIPAVLMLHGYGSTADEVGNMYARLADALDADGIASLRIDFAGMGASEASTLDYTYDSMIADASTALEWLAQQDGVDPAAIGVQGFSLGSTIGAHLVGTDTRPIAFGSWSGAIEDGVSADDDMLAQCEATGEGHIEVDLGFRTLDHSCDYWTSAATSTALTDFAPYSGALLLVAGSADETVDPAVSENAATASASQNVVLVLVQGADHIYHVLTEDQTDANEVIAVTAAWYSVNL